VTDDFYEFTAEDYHRLLAAKKEGNDDNINHSTRKVKFYKPFIINYFSALSALMYTLFIYSLYGSIWLMTLNMKRGDQLGWGEVAWDKATIVLTVYNIPLSLCFSSFHPNQWEVIFLSSRGNDKK